MENLILEKADSISMGDKRIGEITGKNGYVARMAVNTK